MYRYILSAPGKEKEVPWVGFEPTYVTLDRVPYHLSYIRAQSLLYNTTQNKTDLHYSVWDAGTQ